MGLLNSLRSLVHYHHGHMHGSKAVADREELSPFQSSGFEMSEPTPKTILINMAIPFSLLTACFMNKPRGTNEYQNAPSVEGVCWPGHIPPVSTPVTELARICSLVGMPQPDFSFLRTTQV